jgi:hypothetical protein
MDELFLLHLRLTLDTSPALFGVATGRGRIKATKEGRAWLKDYYRYEDLYRSLNQSRFRGSGPADLALNQRFGVALEEEEA